MDIEENFDNSFNLINEVFSCKYLSLKTILENKNKISSEIIDSKKKVTYELCLNWISINKLLDAEFKIKQADLRALMLQIISDD